MWAKTWRQVLVSADQHLVVNADQWDGEDYKYLDLVRANGTYGEMAGVGAVEGWEGTSS